MPSYRTADNTTRTSGRLKTKDELGENTDVPLSSIVSHHNGSELPLHGAFDNTSQLPAGTDVANATDLAKQSSREPPRDQDCCESEDSRLLRGVLTKTQGQAQSQKPRFVTVSIPWSLQQES